MMRWNSTKSYTEEDIIKMREEAVSRVHEFQERAKGYSFYDIPPMETIYPPEPVPEPVIEAESRVVSPSPSPSPPVHTHHAVSNDPLGGLLSSFNLDSETLLILGLMFVLYNEKADHVLLLALAYLLL